ncbi:Probable histone H2AXb [Linum perenne]
MSSVATGSTKGGRGKGKTTKFISRSSKARLQFPVGPGSSRPGLELARNAARDNKKNKIVPRHIQLWEMPRDLSRSRSRSPPMYNRQRRSPSPVGNRYTRRNRRDKSQSPYSSNTHSR